MGYEHILMELLWDRTCGPWSYVSGVSRRHAHKNTHANVPISLDRARLGLTGAHQLRFQLTKDYGGASALFASGDENCCV